MKKLLALPALALASCAPGVQTHDESLSTVTQAHFAITCSSALSQLRDVSAHLRPVPFPAYGWRIWSELMVDHWNDTELVLTSTRSRTDLFPNVPVFTGGPDVYRVTITCAEAGRSADLTLRSTGLSQAAQQRVHQRLLRGVTVF